METRKNPVAETAPIREAGQRPERQAAMAGMPIVKTHMARRCEDCRAENAFHAWRSQHLTPSLNWDIDFSGAVNIPSGKRAVIELVTATIQVPRGESARLRLYTSLGFDPSNLDLVLIRQGQAGGRETLVATHTIRAYSDNHISFNVNRDNAETEADAIVCISGYLVDV